MKWSFALLGILMSLPPAAQASVTFLPNSASHGAVHIKFLNPSTFPSHVVDGIGEGMGQWNHHECNVNQERFPTFSTTFVEGDPTIEVKWITDIVGEVCAKSEERAFDGSFARVLMYRQVELPDGSVKDCYDSKAIANDSFAHELGHYLGLGESSCSSMITSPRSLTTSGAWDLSRKVQAEECDAADNKNDTPAEEECQRGDPDCDPEADPYSPILIDLDRGGFRLSGAVGAVLFDLDADGENEWTAWPVAGSQDAFLCWDRNQNGLIDDGRELFGNATVLFGGAIARHGYLPLQEIDHPALTGNGNGLVEAGDGDFGKLCLWRDGNRDGISQAEELTSLSSMGIAALEYEPHESRRRDRHGNEFRFFARVWRWHQHDILVPLKSADVFLKTW